MDSRLTLADGRELVRAARQAIQDALAGRTPKPASGSPALEQPRGVFVTLETHPQHELRGCIGFTEADRPLGQAVADAAVHAAIHDFRFEPVGKSELAKLVVEVSALTPPVPLAAPAAERAKAIEVGKDGLIVKYGRSSGLLLPQVAIEWNWSAREFLEEACQKAGLPRAMWSSPTVQFHTFQAQIFSEKTPEGAVEERRLFR